MDEGRVLLPSDVKPDAAPAAAANPHCDRRSFLRGSATAAAAVLAMGTLVRTIEAKAASPQGQYDVQEIENIWITLPDGVRLAARAWIPVGQPDEVFPAIFEYIPYRKRDLTRSFDELTHPYLAARGYACFRVDIRGYGDSEGLPQNEYSEQEQEDGVAVVEWLSRQPWSSGRVGAFGISWGGFTALQIAAKAPPALKAIITHCSTDDRYTDDAHYMGGTVISDMMNWGISFTTQGLSPPDPDIVGERWLDMWTERLNHLDFFVGEWVSNQHRNDFWKSGSINEDYASVQCAVYAVGGWVDSYSSAVPRMLANLDCPRKGLVGPWTHDYPHIGRPEPAIDWLTEALRWWDYWLKDIDTGIMDDPMYRAYLQHEVLKIGETKVPGHWVAEEQWPPAQAQVQTLHFGDDGLMSEPVGSARPRSSVSPQTLGTASPNWLPFDLLSELPDDQRVDDGRSITFDSVPLEQDFDIFGAPVVTLRLKVDKPVAFVVLRLNEVEPDGYSNRVTYHVRNLTHRDSHEAPSALEPGKVYDVAVPLHDCAHRFSKGNKIRVAVSTTSWPMVWPAPEPVKLTLLPAGCRMTLPLRAAQPQDERLRDLGEPFVPETGDVTIVEKRGGLDKYGGAKTMRWNVGEQLLTIESEGSTDITRIEATGSEIGSTWGERSEIRDDDPTSAKVEIWRSTMFRRGAWDTEQTSTLALELTPTAFLLTGKLEAVNSGEVVFEREWNEVIDRKLV
jgi:putative CocE/NonD family hydrolase